MTNKKKVVVVGNCQARPIATLLEAMSDEIEVTKVAIVHLLNSDQEAEYKPFFEEADYIIAQLVNDEYPCEFVRTKNLASRFSDKLIKIINIFSKIDFPNWYSLNYGDEKLIGPLDIYHNKVIYDSWKKGLSIPETITSLRDNSLLINKKKGCESILKLKEREMEADVLISDIIETESQNRLFHIYNHPSNFLLSIYSTRILKKLAVSYKTLEADNNVQEYLGRISIPEEFDFSGGGECKGYSVSLHETKVSLGDQHQYNTADLIRAFFQVYNAFPPGLLLEKTNGIKSKNNVLTLDGQMFLHQKNTGQRQFDYFLGKKILSEEVRENFKKNISNNRILSEKYHFLYKHIIFPAKPVVFKKLFEKKGIFLQSLQQQVFSDEKVVLYPKLNEEDYDVSDTHTNDKGVFKILKLIINDFGLLKDVSAEFSVGEKLNDLSSMLGLPFSNYCKLTSIDYCHSFNDFTKSYALTSFLESNTGDFEFHINKYAPINKRLFLFGDSFFKTRIHIFTALFNEVIYIRAPYVIEDLVACLQPDVVLSGNAERYLVNTPSATTPRPFFMNYIVNPLKSKPTEELILAFEALFSGRESVRYKTFKKLHSTDITENILKPLQIKKVDIKGNDDKAFIKLMAKFYFNKDKIKYIHLNNITSDSPKIEFNRYDRTDLNNDNSHFGVECGVVDIEEFNVTNSYEYELDEVLHFGDVSSEKAKFTGRIAGNVKSAVIEINNADVFLPNGAVYDKQKNKLIKPSLWQSRLFENPIFRNDKSTKWEWRVDVNYDAPLLSGVTLILHNRCYTNYFHWFIDVVSKLKLIKDLSIYDHIIIGSYEKDTYHEQTLDLLGIDKSKIFWVDGYQIIRCETGHYPYYKLTEDVGIRANYHEKIHYKGWCSEFINSIADMFKPFSVNVGETFPKKIFISRKDATARNLVNFHDVESLLISRGYTELNPSEMTLSQQISAFSHATHIVSVHGAAMTNILWCSKDTKVVELMPNDYDDPGYRMIAGMKKMTGYSLLFCKAINPLGRVFSDLEVDVELLDELI